jgi:hypothetical protein
MGKTIRIFVLLASLTAAFAAAQYKTEQRSIFNPSELARKPTGLFDKLFHSPRFRMTQSYSLSFFSMGGQAFNQGMYLNSMSYQISDPLLAQVQIGYLNQPFGAWGNSAQTAGKLFVRSASLQYHPSDNMHVRFDYETMPAYSLSPYSGTGLR